MGRPNIAKATTTVGPIGWPLAHASALTRPWGFLFHINGIHFGGMLSPTYGVSFESLSAMGPFDAWNAVPLFGQIQIIWTIAGLEHASECLDPAGHYTKGGTPGNTKFLSACPVQLQPNATPARRLARSSAVTRPTTAAALATAL